MKKQFKFSDGSKTAKIVYGIVIAVLCVSAVVLGILAAANQKPTEELPPVEEKKEEVPEKKPLVYVSPAVGTVLTPHSTTLPVFSQTLGEWRIHTGIDIETDEGASVYAAADGVVTDVRDDAKYGKTVEITHEDGVVTVYSNLAKTLAAGIEKGKEVKGGDKLGTVGDTALTELAEEAHLHFAVRKDGVSCDPLDLLSEDSKRASLGLE